MEGRMRSFLAICLIPFVCGFAHASEAQLKEGNRLFKNRNYKEALKQYNDALIDSPDSNVLRYNAGDAAYQAGDFATAEKGFRETAEKAPDPTFRAAARYNQGNALFRQQKLPEAVEAYKDSLRVNPQDEDAKYNLSVALNALKNPKSQNQRKSGGGGKSPAEARREGEMSKEDAERLLSAVGAGEQKKQPAKKAEAPHPDEDW
jgi:Ca-activated chloride channel family protein